MSTHPNVILMAVLTPDDLSRKTMRDILAENEVKFDDEVVIRSEEYHSLIMETDYDEEFQISADVGDLVFFNLVTYGYGETIVWKNLEEQKIELEEWAKKTCERHHCSYSIRVTANYW